MSAARGKYTRTYTLGFALPINSYRWQPFPSQRRHLVSLCLPPLPTYPLSRARSLARSLVLSLSFPLRYPCKITYVTSMTTTTSWTARGHDRARSERLRAWERRPACKLRENVTQGRAQNRHILEGRTVLEYQEQREESRGSDGAD